jgi:preprotein translocase subunit SecE
MFNKTIQFLKEIRVELGKVTWPNKNELVGSTIVVVVVSLLLSAFTGVVDFILSRLAGLVLR